MGNLGGGGIVGGGAVYTEGYRPGYGGQLYRSGSIFGGSILTSEPFLRGVTTGLVATATGDTEVGGVTQGGFFSFFGCLFGVCSGGESPPDD